MVSTCYHALSRSLRCISGTDPNHGTWTFAYDSASRLIRQTDARGQRSEYQFDAQGRMIARQHYTAANAQTQWHTYAYDFADADKCPTRVAGSHYNGGKLCRMAGHWGSSDVNSDRNGLKVQQRWTLKGVTYSITDTRDAGGYVIAKAYSDGDAIGSVSNPWTYDRAGRLASIPGHVNGFVYNARGQVVTAGYANSVTTTNVYNDARGWLNRVQTLRGATALQDLTYARAATGRISSVSASNAIDTWTYAYDDLDRLLSATNAGNSALSQTFTYDAAHNMLSNSSVGAYTSTRGHLHRPSQRSIFDADQSRSGGKIARRYTSKGRAQRPVMAPGCLRA